MTHGGVEGRSESSILTRPVVAAVPFKLPIVPVAGQNGGRSFCPSCEKKRALELKVKLLGWRHPGFSTHVREPIPPNDARAIEDMASRLVLHRLVAEELPSP
jgi:hypothetical protein